MNYWIAIPLTIVILVGFVEMWRWLLLEQDRQDSRARAMRQTWDTVEIAARQIRKS